MSCVSRRLRMVCNIYNLGLVYIGTQSSRCARISVKTSTGFLSKELLVVKKQMRIRSNVGKLLGIGTMMAKVF